MSAVTFLRWDPQWLLGWDRGQCMTWGWEDRTGTSRVQWINQDRKEDGPTGAFMKRGTFWNITLNDARFQRRVLKRSTKVDVR